MILRSSAISAATLLVLAGVARAQSPVYDIPRLSQTATENKNGWDAEGFAVDTLAPVTGKLRATNDFDAALRLGWSDKGLLVRVRVQDDTVAESDDPTALWQKDSIELFWGVKQGERNWVHIQISPGVDPKHKESRIYIDDHRENKIPGMKPVEIKAVTRTITMPGKPPEYTVETLLPWEMLGITPREGTEIAFQLAVNDVDGTGPRAQLMWFPEEGAYNDPGKMNRIRLSRKASPPVRLAAIPSYTNFPRTRLKLVAQNTGMVTASDSKGEIGHINLTKDEVGRATGELILRRVPEGNVRLSIPDQPPVPIPLQDSEALRKAAFANAPVEFSSYVFTGSTLPRVDFAKPERVESLIGPYTLTTTYYNAEGQAVTTADKPGRYGAVVAIRSDSGQFEGKRYATLTRVAAIPDWNDWGGKFTGPLPPAFGIAPEVAREQTQNTDDFLKDSFYTAMDRQPNAAIFIAGMLESKPGDPVVERLSAEQRDRRWWYGIKKQRGEAPDYRYLVQTPKDYDADKAKKWPVLLFLHGSGERGNDLKTAAVHGPLKYIREGHDLPFIVINPQCEPGDYWQPERVVSLLEEIKRKYRVDESRLYLTGLSMGGYGTWSTALAYPDLFAAILPICGGGDPADATRIVHVPVWDFHGGKDPNVPIRLSEEMIAALKKAGATEVEFTVYPEAGHDSWTVTYNNPEVYTWLLKHHK